MAELAKVPQVSSIGLIPAARRRQRIFILKGGPLEGQTSASISASPAPSQALAEGTWAVPLQEKSQALHSGYDHVLRQANTSASAACLRAAHLTTTGANPQPAILRRHF